MSPNLFVLSLSQLEDNGVMPVLLNPHSNIVVFPKPADEGIVRRWQLATSGDIAHVVVMPTIQMETLAAFARECGHSLATHGEDNLCVGVR